MKFTIKGPFSMDERDQTLKVSAGMVISWSDKRLALTSYPDCWVNQTVAPTCSGRFMHIREPAVLKGQVKGMQWTNRCAYITKIFRAIFDWTLDMDTENRDAQLCPQDRGFWLDYWTTAHDGGWVRRKSHLGEQLPTDCVMSTELSFLSIWPTGA